VEFVERQLGVVSNVGLASPEPTVGGDRTTRIGHRPRRQPRALWPHSISAPNQDKELFEDAFCWTLLPVEFRHADNVMGRRPRGGSSSINTLAFERTWQS